MSKGNTITPSDLPATLKLNEKRDVFVADSLKTTIEETERLRILTALEKTNWVQAKAAKLLGITPRQIGYKIVKYGIKK